MDHDVQRLLRYLNETCDSPHPSGDPAWFGENPDAEVLDTCSRAVGRIADRVSPCVLAITGDDASPVGGSIIGSGVVISPDGFALTSSTVIAGRRNVGAVTHEGERCDAIVVGEDSATDLALVKVTSNTLLHALLARSQSLRVGQFVIAMGNPYALQPVATMGTISTLNGVLPPGAPHLESVLQHTCAVQPGCAGGPLVDARGHVVGILAGTSHHGVSFAVPSETVSWVVGEILRRGSVQRAPIGVSIGSIRLSKRLVRSLDLLNSTGVQVSRVAPGSAAARAGVREGDVITGVCGRIVAGIDDFHRVLSRVGAGTSIAMDLIRAGKVMEVQLHTHANA